MLFDNNNLIYVGFVQKSFRLNGQMNILTAERLLNKILVKYEPVFIDIQGIPVPFFIEDVKPNGTNIILKLKYIDSDTEADKYRNCRIYIEEKFIKKYEQFEPTKETQLADFLNYEVYDQKYGFIGHVENINKIPGNPVIEINFNRKIIMLPFSENFIIKIDEENKQIFISSPDGLIDIYL